MFSVLHAKKEESLVKFITCMCDVGVEVTWSMARVNCDSVLFDGS